MDFEGLYRNLRTDFPRKLFICTDLFNKSTTQQLREVAHFCTLNLSICISFLIFSGFRAAMQAAPAGNSAAVENTPFPKEGKPSKSLLSLLEQTVSSSLN